MAAVLPPGVTPLASRDLELVTRALGRFPRGVLGVAARGSEGQPQVICTSPLIEGRIPFPTFYYLVDVELIRECSKMEAAGEMRKYQELLGQNPELQHQYDLAHHQYLQVRQQVRYVPELEGISAGGMPQRVKCLHALLAHALGAGEGINPIGDRVRDAIWRSN